MDLIWADWLEEQNRWDDANNGLVRFIFMTTMRTTIKQLPPVKQLPSEPLTNYGYEFIGYTGGADGNGYTSGGNGFGDGLGQGNGNSVCVGDGYGGGYYFGYNNGHNFFLNVP